MVQGICVGRTARYFFIQPPWNDPFLMMKKKHDVVFSGRKRVRQMIIDETAIAVHAAGSAENVADTFNHQRDCARSQHGVFKIDFVQRDIDAAELRRQAKGRRFGRIVKNDPFEEFVNMFSV